MSNSSPGNCDDDPASASMDDNRFASDIPINADDKIRNAFIKDCLKAYSIMDWKGDWLFEYCADDFSSFGAEDFALLPKIDSQLLRELLRRRDVYVRKGHGSLYWMLCLK